MHKRYMCTLEIMFKECFKHIISNSLCSCVFNMADVAVSFSQWNLDYEEIIISHFLSHSFYHLKIVVKYWLGVLNFYAINNHENWTLKLMDLIDYNCKLEECYVTKKSFSFLIPVLFCGIRLKTVSCIYLIVDWEMHMDV